MSSANILLNDSFVRTASHTPRPTHSHIGSVDPFPDPAYMGLYVYTGLYVYVMVGGLCVLTFLRVRTWMRVDDMDAAAGMTADAVHLGELEPP